MLQPPIASISQTTFDQAFIILVRCNEGETDDEDQFAEIYCKFCNSNIDRYRKFFRGYRALETHILREHGEAFGNSNMYKFILEECIVRHYTLSEVADIKAGRSEVIKKKNGETVSNAKAKRKGEVDIICDPDSMHVPGHDIEHVNGCPPVIVWDDYQYYRLACPLRSCRANADEHGKFFPTLNNIMQHVEQEHCEIKQDEKTKMEILLSDMDKFVVRCRVRKLVASEVLEIKEGKKTVDVVNRSNPNRELSFDTSDEEHDGEAKGSESFSVRRS